jgi:hypothetical protein
MPKAIKLQEGLIEVVDVCYHFSMKIEVDGEPQVQ